MLLDANSLQVINDILSRGHTVEIRKRKSEIVIVEMQGKIKQTVITDM